MKKEEVASAMKVLSAYKAGRIIQWKSKGEGAWSGMQVEGGELSFNFERNDYRVKPESKHIPYTVKDAQRLINRIVSTKVEPSQLFTITGVVERGVFINGTLFGYNVFLEEMIFFGGEACGTLMS